MCLVSGWISGFLSIQRPKDTRCPPIVSHHRNLLESPLRSTLSQVTNAEHSGAEMLSRNLLLTSRDWWLAWEERTLLTGKCCDEFWICLIKRTHTHTKHVNFMHSYSSHFLNWNDLGCANDRHTHTQRHTLCLRSVGAAPALTWLIIMPTKVMPGVPMRAPKKKKKKNRWPNWKKQLIAACLSSFLEGFSLSLSPSEQHGYNRCAFFTWCKSHWCLNLVRGVDLWFIKRKLRRLGCLGCYTGFISFSLNEETCTLLSVVGLHLQTRISLFICFYRFKLHDS